MILTFRPEARLLNGGNRALHLVEGLSQEAAHADNVGLDLPDFLHEDVRGHIDADVMDFEVVHIEHETDDILPDVMNVTRDSSQKDFSEDLAGSLGRQPRLHESADLLEKVTGDDQLGKEVFLALVAVADNGHGFPARIEDFLRISPRIQHFPRQPESLFLLHVGDCSHQSVFHGCWLLRRVGVHETGCGGRILTHGFSAVNKKGLQAWATGSEGSFSQIDAVLQVRLQADAHVRPALAVPVGSLEPRSVDRHFPSAIFTSVSFAPSGSKLISTIVS